MTSKLKQWQQAFSLRYSAWLLHGLQRITFWNDKIQQRLSAWGLAVIAALVLTLVFGANIKLSSIYQLFALLLTLFVVALLAVWFKSFGRHQQRLNIRRGVPKFATVGTNTTYYIHLENPHQKDVGVFNISERLTMPIINLNQFLNAKEPDEEKRNWYDRHTGYYRFVWLKKWLQGAVFSSQKVSGLAAGKQQQCMMQFMPLRRGYIHLPMLRLRFAEPLGLAYNMQDITVSDSILVLPKAYQLPNHHAWGGQRKFQQGGVAQASHVGDSEEFSHLREYRDGDSLRHIFWASLARSQTPLVKNYQDEYFSHAALVLDNDVACDKRMLFEEAVSVAAGFAMAEHSQEMLLDMLFVGEHDHAAHTLTGRAIAHQTQMLETLAVIHIQEGSFSGLSAAVLQQAENINGCVLVFTAWDDARQALVEALHALSVPVAVLLVQEQGATDVFDEAVVCLRMSSIQEDLDAWVDKR